MERTPPLEAEAFAINYWLAASLLAAPSGLLSFAGIFAANGCKTHSLAESDATGQFNEVYGSPSLRTAAKAIEYTVIQVAETGLIVLRSVDRARTVVLFPLLADFE
jgi:hypothetical protein